ncbi:hypothetical protein GGTG_04774 [Gaeumannomyces tritici R3-111a-1]|uniref:Uncharacterized protein n=1 Tax=Gaeumannomyces tritici (strain R3-111a-1) TaxID=644352 RepID=J3NU23_GAET3|nr:hypothetical protein GGTG_04774 [Gaeumannomyces tritici R3-111a-1]EJT79690.1 hypothetical protein GGTG_04774 [Gaeumannomyces tritici R3-111a-1]
MPPMSGSQPMPRAPPGPRFNSPPCHEPRATSTSLLALPHQLLPRPSVLVAVGCRPASRWGCHSPVAATFGWQPFVAATEMRI